MKVHAQVTHAERDSSTGLWQLQSEAAKTGSSGTATGAYAGIILADPMVAAKGGRLQIGRFIRPRVILLQQSEPQ
jgi:hypothetical protein